MPKQQAFNLGRTILVVAVIGFIFGGAWAFYPSIAGWLLMVYGSTD
jgi:hypothetical protein